MTEVTNEQLIETEEWLFPKIKNQEQKDPFVAKTIDSIWIYDPKYVDMNLTSKSTSFINSKEKEITCPFSEKMVMIAGRTNKDTPFQIKITGLFDMSVNFKEVLKDED